MQDRQQIRLRQPMGKRWKQQALGTSHPAYNEKTRGPQGASGSEPSAQGGAYSSVTFCRATTFLYVSYSSLICLANSSGELPMTREPVSSMRLRTAGSCSTLRTAALILSTTSLGMFLGPRMP